MRNPAILLLVALPALAQPSIALIENNYSYTYAGSPNYGIAEGSLFIVQGTNLAPSTQSASLAAGLPTTLNGVSVSVTVGQTTQNAFLYYTYAAGGVTQIGAVLPSSVPVGTGTLTVTNGTNAASAAITVVTTDVGLDTLSGVGTGRAVATDGSGNLLTSTNAANPGQTIVLWGTAVGPDPGNDDHTYPQKQNNLTSLPLEVDVGGVSATIVYRGRSQYPGVDQINVTIPAAAQAGCYVSVVAYTGTNISNFASIPVAASGNTCTDPVPGFGLSLYSSNNTLLPSGNDSTPVNVVYGAEFQALNAAPAINVANIVYENDNQPPTASSVFGFQFPAATYSVQASFLKYSPAALYQMLSEYMVSEGSCTVFPVFPVSLTGAQSGLDAGSSVSIAGSEGSSTLGGDGVGAYQLGLSQSIFGPSPGIINISDGSGGANIGAFNATFTYPFPVLTWNQQNTLTAVDRSQPLTVTWTGGVPGTAVVISGASDADPVPQGGTKYFMCVAPVSAQTFTVPVSVLESLPSTASLDGLNSTAYVGVSNSTNPAAVTGPGITEGWISGLIYDNVGITADTFVFE